jgi:RNA polymerase sigma-70 factor (ECF subfamily)
MEEDATLVRRAMAGCEESFAALIMRHRRLVFGVVWSLLQDFDDAEDAAQETWVLAYRHLSELRDPGRFPAWLCALARNTGYKWLGRRAIEAQRYARLEEMAASPAEEQPTREALHQALGELSPEERVAATLHYLVGLDQAQVAGLLQIPVGTVKSRLHRARKLLKRRLIEVAREQLTSPGEDYGRAVIAGMRGVIHWQKLLDKEGLEGWCSLNPMRQEGEKLAQVWQRSGEAIIGTDVDGEGERLLAGDASWRDYEFSVLITPLEGGNAQVPFRVSEDRRHFYMFDMLLGWQALAISKVDDRGLQKLSVVNFPMEKGREYDVLIAAREASLTAYIDGKLMNQVTDFEYRGGPVALKVWQSKTAFRDPRIRFMS